MISCFTSFYTSYWAYQLDGRLIVKAGASFRLMSTASWPTWFGWAKCVFSRTIYKHRHNLLSSAVYPDIPWSAFGHNQLEHHLQHSVFHLILEMLQKIYSYNKGPMMETLQFIDCSLFFLYDRSQSGRIYCLRLNLSSTPRWLGFANEDQEDQSTSTACSLVAD